MRRQLPDLPPFDSDKAITLRIAAQFVSGERGRCVSASILQRWATRGRRLVTGGDHFIFPSIRTGRERLTTAAWCAAWTRWTGKVRSEAVRRQLEAMAK